MTQPPHNPSPIPLLSLATEWNSAWFLQPLPRNISVLVKKKIQRLFARVAPAPFIARHWDKQIRGLLWSCTSAPAPRLPVLQPPGQPPAAWLKTASGVEMWKREGKDKRNIFLGIRAAHYWICLLGSSCLGSREQYFTLKYS